MVFKAKNELKQYLTPINPIYAKHTEDLWANQVNAISQLGHASLTVLQACGVANLIHAGNIIAQSKATGQWACSCLIFRRLLFASHSTISMHIRQRGCTAGNCKTASSRYIQQVYTAFGLFIASRVHADSQLVSGNSQSCLWLLRASELLRASGLSVS